MTVDRRRLTVGAIALVILAATLTATGGSSRRAFSFCLGCGWRWLSDGLLNIGLFMPLGIAAGWQARSPWKTVLGGALLSTVIEITQTTLPGRDPELADILFNTLGAAFGALIGYRPLFWLAPTPRRAVRFLLGSIAAISLLIAGTSALLAPVRVAPTGQLGPIAALTQRHARLGLTAPASAPPSTLTPLMFYYDDSYTEWLFIGRIGNDAVVRYRSRARRWGLDQPDYVARSVFASIGQATPAQVELWREARHWCIKVGATQDCHLGPTVGRGWAVLYYWDAVGQHWGKLIDACWAAALLLPLGFFTRRRTVPVTLAAGLALFALAPAMLALLPTTVAEWLGGVLGAWTGYLLSLAVRRRVPSVG